MLCYFCGGNLSEECSRIKSRTSEKYLFCFNKKCQISGIPRHKVTLLNDVRVHESIIFDKFYIQFNYLKDQTSISKLDIIILSGTVYINKIIIFDFKDSQSTLLKIKNILIFS
jgi:hypothetical protein